ncbi:MAG: ATP-grasp domain-containing protein [Ardenticatenaceae bacterium]|nr:ATP-grasp domain-containing protein [Ardenticatenaceae bacterium]
MQNRILLLTTPRSYRVQPFLEAAERLGIEAVQGLDLPNQLAEQWQMELGLDFQDVAGATEKIVKVAEKRPFQAILSVDDSGSLLAASASSALHLPHNNPEAAVAARDKFVMRQKLQAGGVACPRFQRFPLAADPHEAASQVSFPCVVKPLTLNGSRGVIRADNSQEFAAAVLRLRRMLPRTEPQFYLVEQFVPGFEVALEGILENGRLTVLALFDKPDPLDGPFFEETIYVTPSRLSQAVHQTIAACTSQAAQALGLRTGPVHAELRVNDDGPWLIEMAGRSIGGLCSQTLRFGVDGSLEEMIVRQACGLALDLQPNGRASGVMMIPIPEAGLLKGITGLEAAQAVPLIESIEITAKLNYPLVPLPEGDSYLGFIFARGETATAVEAALREAHSQLHFEITPQITLTLAN